MQNELDHRQRQQIPNAGYDLYDAEQHEDHAKRHVQAYIGRMFVAFAARTHVYRVGSLGLIIIFGIRNRWQVNRARRAFLDPLVRLSLSLSFSPKKSRFDSASLWLSGHFNRLHSIYYSSFQRSN